MCIGRWRVLHDGHKAMIYRVWEKNKRPVWVQVMDTDEDPPAKDRAVVIQAWLQAKSIPSLVTVIPPIASVNYGRGVGYEINEVHLPAEVEAISATNILNGGLYDNQSSNATTGKVTSRRGCNTQRNRCGVYRVG